LSALAPKLGEVGVEFLCSEKSSVQHVGDARRRARPISTTRRLVDVVPLADRMSPALTARDTAGLPAGVVGGHQRGETPWCVTIRPRCVVPAP